MKLTKKTEKWNAYFENPDYGQIRNETYSEKKYKDGLLILEYEEADCFQEDRISKKREIFYDDRNRIKKEIITELKNIGNGVTEIYEAEYEYQGNSYRRITKKKYSSYPTFQDNSNGVTQVVDKFKEVDEIKEILEVNYENERIISKKFNSLENGTNWTTEYNYYNEDELDNYYLKSIIGPHEIDGHDFFKSNFQYQNGKLIKEKHFNKEGVMLLYKEYKDIQLIVMIEYIKSSYDIKSPDYKQTLFNGNLITDEYLHKRDNSTKGEKSELKPIEHTVFIYDESVNILTKRYHRYNNTGKKFLVKQDKFRYTKCNIRNKEDGIIKNYNLPVEIISLCRVENEDEESSKFEEKSKTTKTYYQNSINLFEEKEWTDNKLSKHVVYEYKNDNCVEKRTRFYNEFNNQLESSELESFDYDEYGNLTFHVKLKISGNEVVGKTTKHFVYDKK